MTQFRISLFLVAVFTATVAYSQQVTLPLPRLLTIMPMGGQAGTEVEVTITGDNLENISELLFSSPSIKAKPVLAADGKPVPNTYLVSIAQEAAVGVYDAHVLSRLGVSSARAFSVSKLPEVTRTTANNTPAAAMPLATNSICNATMTKRAVDHYSFKGTKGKRVTVDCAAAGIDSRLTPVVILADATGSDLIANRTGGPLDFIPPADGDYLIKVNDLTFQGGNRHFYRLALQESPEQGSAMRQPSTRKVSAMSWPPVGLATKASVSEKEPNNLSTQTQQVSLPCDLQGSFYPAADVDTFEFTAKKGEVWWVEVASERLGLNTDPFVLVQQVKTNGDEEILTDVAELYDIAPPMKVSSNGYSYDGPPYDAGSPDINGKFEVKEDGKYRLQVRDLFGGTRSDPNNFYRLVVRQATPDFSLVAWAVHMTLRNGDRSAFSKPLALRAGESRVFEVVVQRRDGFDGEIDIVMSDLPPGVTAAGLKIGSGKSYGHLILTASSDVKPGFALAKISGRASIKDNVIERPCPMASMAWPVVDAKSEIPSPRLLADVPVSVTDSEAAPVTIAVAADNTLEVKTGATLTIPLKVTWRNEFTGTSLKLKAYGNGFTTLKDVDIPIKAATAEVIVDTAALKLAPGDYAFALYGSAVSKYRYNPTEIQLAEAEQKQAQQLAAAAAKLAATDAGAADKKKQADASMEAATKRMKSVVAAAEPKDTVEIIVSEPIRISVKDAQVAAAPAGKP